MFFAISYFNTFISHLTNKDTYQVLISICKKTSSFFPVLHSTSTYLLDLLVKALFKSQAISPAFLAHKTHVCQLSQGGFNANCHIPPMGWPPSFFFSSTFLRTKNNQGILGMPQVPSVNQKILHNGVEKKYGHQDIPHSALKNEKSFL